MANIFGKDFFKGLFNKQQQSPVKLPQDDKTYDEGLKNYQQGIKGGNKSPMNNPILDRYYKGLTKSENKLEKGKMIKVDKPFSKRYMFDDDLGQKATAENKLPNAKTSGWTGLYTGKQMDKAGEDIGAKDVNAADIESTAISNFKYNPKTGNLYIRFKGGNKTYLFPKVPLDAVKSFLRAPSKGTYYNKSLKKYAVPAGEAIAIAKKYKGK